MNADREEGLETVGNEGNEENLNVKGFGRHVPSALIRVIGVVRGYPTPFATLHLRAFALDGESVVLQVKAESESCWDSLLHRLNELPDCLELLPCVAVQDGRGIGRAAVG